MEITSTSLPNSVEANPEIENLKMTTLNRNDNEVGSMEIFIEEISRGQKLLHRHRLTKDKIAIGRGYDNDIILADPHICPNHLVLSFNNGVWSIEDKYSINGTFLENPKEKKQAADKHIVEDGDILSIGKSQLRILFSDHKVADTISFSPFESFINFMRHPIALFMSITLFTLVAGIISYLDQPVELNFSQLLVNSIGISLLLSLWPAIVALVSHLTKHDARIMTQLGISFAFFNLMWVSDLLETIVAFNSANGAMLTVLSALLPIGLAFCLFWFNCNIGFHLTAKRQVVVAASITTLLFGGGYLIQYSKKPEFSARPQYDSTLMAPSFLFASSSTVDEFIKDSSALFDKANKAAQKK